MRSIAHFDLHVARLQSAQKPAEMRFHFDALRRRRARARLLAIPPPLRRAVGFRLVEAGLALALEEPDPYSRELGLAQQ